MSLANLVAAAAAEIRVVEIPNCTDLVSFDAEVRHDEELFLHFIQLRRAERQRIREEQELQRLQKLGKLPVAVLDGQGPVEVVAASTASDSDVKHAEVADISQSTLQPPRLVASTEAARKRKRPASAPVQPQPQPASKKEPSSESRPSPLQSCLADDGSVRGGCMPALIEVAQKAEAPALRLAILEALERTATSEPHRIARFSELHGPQLLAEWLLQKPSKSPDVAQVAARASEAARYAPVAAACLRVFLLLPLRSEEIVAQGLLQVCSQVGASFTELRKDAMVLVAKWRECCSKETVQNAKAGLSEAEKLQNLKPHQQKQQPDSIEATRKSKLSQELLKNSQRTSRGRSRGQMKPEMDVAATLKEIQELGEILESQRDADEALQKHAPEAMRQGKGCMLPETKKEATHTFPSTNEAESSDCWDGYFPDPFV